MKKGEIVLISFTGKDLATGKVFDTTDEGIAKKEEIFKEKGIYKPIPVIVGKGEVLKGMDKQLEKMKEGEQKTIKLDSSEAFGERKKELIAVVPLREFKARKINPFPGLTVELNNQKGRIQSVSGGRVRVDFNPELAGREIEYKIKIEKKLVNKKEQIQALFEKYFPFIQKPLIELKEKKGIVEINIPAAQEKNALQLKPFFAQTILENIKGIKKLVYKEEYLKKEKK